MYQYDDPTVTANLPVSTAAGTAGYFTDGNPAGGQPATILRAEFMNMLMMELVNAIAGAGITPSKSTFTQLKEAIEAYITARAASSSDAGIVALSTNAETQDGELSTVAVTPASLASRTATETRTGLVELATNAEAQGGTDTARAVTPAGIAAIMSTHKNNALAHGLVGAGGVGTYLLTGSSATGDPTPWGFGYAGTWENLTVNSTHGSTYPDYIPLIEGGVYGKFRLWRRTL